MVGVHPIVIIYTTSQKMLIAGGQTNPHVSWSYPPHFLEVDELLRWERSAKSAEPTAALGLWLRWSEGDRALSGRGAAAAGGPGDPQRNP